MDLQIRSHGTKVSDGLQPFIDRRMAKLDRIADRVVEAHLELRTEELRTGRAITTAQLTLRTGRHVLRAEERDEEAAKAIDASIDKLVGQGRRVSDKRSKRGRRSSRMPSDGFALAPQTTLDVPGELELEGDAPSPVVRTKRFQMKPMAVEEAIDQMELIGHEFFLFRNADEDQLNVLYRRRDGTFGLIAPARS